MIALLLAATLVGPPEPRPMRDLVAEPYLRVSETLPLAAISGGFDLWTAEHLFETCTAQPGCRARELAWLGQSTGKRAALQLAHTGATVYVVHGVDRRYGRKAAKRTLWTIVGIKAAAGLYQLLAARGVKE